MPGATWATNSTLSSISDTHGAQLGCEDIRSRQRVSRTRACGVARLRVAGAIPDTSVCMWFLVWLIRVWA